MESQRLPCLSHLVDLPSCVPTARLHRPHEYRGLAPACSTSCSIRPRASSLRAPPFPQACCTLLHPRPQIPRAIGRVRQHRQHIKRSRPPLDHNKASHRPCSPRPTQQRRRQGSQKPGARSQKPPKEEKKILPARSSAALHLAARLSVAADRAGFCPVACKSGPTQDPWEPPFFRPSTTPLHSLPPQQAANPFSLSRSPSEAHRLHSQALADSAIGSAVAAATCPPAAPADAWLPLQPGHGLASCDLRRLSPFSTGRRSSPIVLCTRFLYVWSIVALPFFQCSQPVSGTLLFFFFESFSRPPGCQRYTLDAPPAYETIACSHLPRCPQIFPAPDALLTEGQSTACSGYPISALSDVLLSAFGSQPGSLLNDSAARGQPSLRGGG